MPRHRHIVLCALLLCLPLARARGDDTEQTGLQSFGIRAAYGNGDRHSLTFASLLPRISFFLPYGVDQPLARYNWHAEWLVEPIVSYITNSTATVEAGVNPLFFSLRYDQGQRLVPFVEGGEGVLYTDLRGERLGTRFQFSSQGGAGLHWFFSQTKALTIGWRIRHISNAGISHPNRGLNTNFFEIGLSV